MKVTKSKLAQIIKEELEATTAVATNEIYLPFIGGKMHPDTLSWAQDQAKRAIDSARFMAEGEPLSVQEEVDYAIEDLEDATKRMEYYVSNRHKESEAERAQKRHDKALAAIRAVSSSIAQSSRDKRKLAQAAEMKKQAAADKRWKAGAKQRAHFAKRQAEIQMRDKEKFAKEWWYNNAGLGSQERASEKWDSVINSRDKDRFINGGGSELEWPMHAAKKSADERKGRRMREGKITKSKLAQIIQEELTAVKKEALLQEINFMKKLANFARNGSSSKGWESAVEDFAAEDDKAEELVSQAGLQGGVANMPPEELAKKMAAIVAAVQKSGDKELMAALQGLAQDGSTAMGGEEQGSSAPSGGGGEVTSTAFAEFSNLLSQIATKFEVDGNKLMKSFQAFLKGQGFDVEGLNEEAMVYADGAPMLGDLGDMIKKYEMFGTILAKALQSKYANSVTNALKRFGFGDVDAFLGQIKGEEAGEEEAGEEEAGEEAGEEAVDGPVPLFKGDDALYSKLYSSIKSRLSDSEWDEAAKNKQGLQTMVKSILKDLSSQLRANDIQVSEGQLSEKVTPTFRPVKGAEKGMSFNYVSASGVKTAVKVANPAKDSKEGDTWKGVKTTAQIIDPETCKPKGTGAARALTPDRVGAPIPQCSPKTARSMERGGAATMSPTDVGGRIKPTKGEIKSGQAIAGKIHKLISDTYGGTPKDLKDIQATTQKLVTTIIVKLVKPFLSKYLKGKDIQLKESKFNALSLSLAEIMLVETLDASRGKNMMPKMTKALTEGTTIMKITKSQLNKIIQEELVGTIEEGMMDAIRSKLSPKRPAKAPYQKSENDKEKMYQMGVEDANDAMHISGDYRESPSSDDEDYMAGWNDTIQGANSAMQEGKNKMKITKSALAQIVQEELSAVTAEGYGNYKRDDNDWGDLEENEIYALEALMSLGGEQPAGDIAAIASEEYANAIGTEELEDFGDYIQTALDSLQAKGKVRLTQGEPGSGVEAFYALA